MKKFLLPQKGEFFKANLHCHTNISDGVKTPEEIKQGYKEHGYSAVAFTDHDKYISHQDLNDENFIALNGFELEYYREGFTWQGITTHVCFVAKKPDNEALGWSNINSNPFAPKLMPGEHPLKVGGGLYTVLPCQRGFDPSYISADMKRGRELGFFVSYNHPTWSLESYDRYSQFENFDAMEICNFSCCTKGYDEDNGRVYNDIIALGKKAACIATDDNHNDYNIRYPYEDSYGGYVMIKAPSLSYENLTTALERHEFYSVGMVNDGSGPAPEIYNLWIEDGIIHIETSPAQNILFITDDRSYNKKCAENGDLITEASFFPRTCKWFRIVVISKGGNKAYTNAYFLNE